MIKLVCLSDLHLGEGESMIHHLFPEAVKRVARRVQEIAGRTLEVDHFVLLGDTLDYSEATVAQAKEEFAAFKEALTSGLGPRGSDNFIGNRHMERDPEEQGMTTASRGAVLRRRRSLEAASG